MAMNPNFYKMLAYHLFTAENSNTVYPIAYLLKHIDAVGNTNPGVTFLGLDDSGNAYEIGSKNGYEFAASVYVTSEVNETGVTVKAVYTVTNTGETEFTISRVKLKHLGTMAGATSVNNQYIYGGQTNLDTPLTIPANGGVGKVTYTVSFVYPT